MSTKTTVTGELRKVLSNLGFDLAKTTIYSDLRKPKGEKAVGAKFIPLTLEDKQIEFVKTEMQLKGFKFHYIRCSKRTSAYYKGCFRGTRFCFSKIN